MKYSRKFTNFTGKYLRNERRITRADGAIAPSALLRKERDSNPRYAKRTTVFETAPIDHSGIFPIVTQNGLTPFHAAKLQTIFHSHKFIAPIFAIRTIFTPIRIKTASQKRLPRKGKISIPPREFHEICFLLYSPL